MSPWDHRSVTLKFQISDYTLFTVNIPLQTRSVRLLDRARPVARLEPPSDRPADDAQGFFVHAVPVANPMPAVTSVGDYLCYVPLQYPHCHIEFSGSFDDYQRKFSAKTRATLSRKVRKYAEHCGGSIRLVRYRTVSEIHEFLRHAREVSAKTYQERLLDAGIPDTDAFVGNVQALASADRVRAFILFDGEKPVSYLYCPVDDGVLTYAFLGYDPDYLKLSVGTVLHWLAIKQLFEEGRFRYLDFTEGYSEHKRLFATHQLPCANVIFLRKSARNAALIYLHLAVDRFSRSLGRILDRLGLKARIKRLLRFAR